MKEFNKNYFNIIRAIKILTDLTSGFCLGGKQQQKNKIYKLITEK